MDLSTLGKWIIITGLVLAGLGAAVWLLGKTDLPFGRLPGDIAVDRENFSFRFPIITCLLISIGLTVLANLILWFLRK